MKKVLLLLMVASAIISCNRMPNDAVIISGTVQNAKDLKTLPINGEEDFLDEITINEDGTFIDTLKPITEGRYFIRLGRSKHPLYLEAGDNIKINIDLENKDNIVTIIEGKNMPINEYLVKSRKDVDKLIAEEMGTFRGLFAQDEATFIESVKKIKDLQLSILNEIGNIPSKFIDKEKKTLEYNRLNNLVLYKQYHGYFAKDPEYEPSEVITKDLESLNYELADDYNNFKSYRDIVVSKFYEVYDKADADKEALIAKVKASTIERYKKDIANLLIEQLGLGTKDLEKKAEQIRSLTTNEKVLKSLDDFLSVAQKLAQGQPSPTFECKSIDGKMVKLSDLKGKLVYIDVWATWCGPCKGELPYLQKLEKDYHGKNIYFVSMSVDQTEEPWRAMVEAQKLGGIQLHADKNWKSSFVEAYAIKGIPRFILLDADGNIISADAPRPSTAEIRTLIDEWLAK